MKKLIAIVTVFVLALSTKVSAQGKVSYQDFHFVIKATEGANSQAVPGGTLQFTRRGNSISNFVFLDSLGNRSVLTSTRPGTNGAPTPECKSKLPDACFGTASKNVGLCICKPTDLTYTIELTTVALTKLAKNAKCVIRID